MRSTAISLGLILLLPVAAQAADQPGAGTDAAPPPQLPTPDVTPPVNAPAGNTAAPVLNWEALVDTFYMYGVGADPTLNYPAARQYDAITNSFSLGYTEIAVSTGPSPVGFRIDLGYGHTGAITNDSLYNASSALSPSTFAQSAGGASGSSSAASALYGGGAFLIQQAYATAQFGEQLTLDAGRFVTSAGAEVMESKSNWNYSRSLLFLGQPKIHTGLRLHYKLNDQTTLDGSLVNGWNNDPDTTGDKTLGTSIMMVPDAKTMFKGTAYIGKQDGPGAAVTDVTMLVDLVFAKTISDTLAVNVNGDFVKTASGNWFGVSAMGKMVQSENLTLTGRIEYLKSKTGYYSRLGLPAVAVTALGDYSLYEATVTAIRALNKNYEIRGEVRIDMASDDVFLLTGKPKSNQVTALVAFLAHI